MIEENMIVGEGSQFPLNGKLAKRSKLTLTSSCPGAWVWTWEYGCENWQ